MRRNETKWLDLHVGSSVGLGETLDAVLVFVDVHDGHTRNSADAALQIAIARGDNVALVLFDALHETVVGVRSLVQATEALEARVLHDPERRRCDQDREPKERKKERVVLEGNAVSPSHLFELTHDAVCDARDACGDVFC